MFPKNIIKYIQIRKKVLMNVSEKFFYTKVATLTYVAAFVLLGILA